ncbi:hypothetical protein M501DRAFT_1035052 [Patellaria atrata CBS 101060]|uniref:Fungal N-terminal domain-containing protein n=1 Tax=Patellaria atrata CBS 101060 TaxID=1346257 RepID=A0A9P4S1Y6_9PEZI|nr:hypothetical protein M501DRAFT_1035052 [Patellaria atrata CBS 101060]
MDLLSITGTSGIVTVLHLLGNVLGYLNDVKDASKERAQCTIEAANLNSLLTTLGFHLEEGGSSTQWYTTLRTLGIKNGPLDQFNQALEELQIRMTGSKKKVTDKLVWKIKKEEITSILSRMESLKTLL